MSPNVTDNRLDKIVEIIGRDASSTIENLASQLGVTKRTIIRDIDKLKRAGVLKRVGPAKGGHWEVSP